MVQAGRAEDEIECAPQESEVSRVTSKTSSIYKLQNFWFSANVKCTSFYNFEKLLIQEIKSLGSVYLTFIGRLNRKVLCFLIYKTYKLRSFTFLSWNCCIHSRRRGNTQGFSLNTGSHSLLSSTSSGKGFWWTCSLNVNNWINKCRMLIRRFRFYFRPGFCLRRL